MPPPRQARSARSRATARSPRSCAATAASVSVSSPGSCPPRTCQCTIRSSGASSIAAAKVRATRAMPNVPSSARTTRPTAPTAARTTMPSVATSPARSASLSGSRPNTSMAVLMGSSRPTQTASTTAAPSADRPARRAAMRSVTALAIGRRPRNRATPALIDRHPGSARAARTVGASNPGNPPESSASTRLVAPSGVAPTSPATSAATPDPSRGVRSIVSRSPDDRRRPMAGVVEVVPITMVC